MPRSLRVIAGPGPRWLLYVHGRTYLVPSRLGKLLAATDPAADPADDSVTDSAADPTIVVAEVRRTLARLAVTAGSPRQRQRRAIWLRVPVVSAPLVDRLARLLMPLASWPVLLAQASSGLVLYLFALSAGPLDGPALADGVHFWLPVVGCFVLTALWHECGHAAALRREGFPAGGFGAGLLLILPVLYCDVTPVAALPRRGRLRVDLAGVCFQLMAGGLLAAAGSWLAEPIPRAAGMLSLLAVFWSLLPFVRSDGHWALADLLGVADLQAPLDSWRGTDRATSRPTGRTRLLATYLVIHRTLEGLFAITLAVLLPWRMLDRLHLDGFVSRFVADGGAALWLLALLLVPLGWIWLRLARRLMRLGRASGRDLRTALGGRPR